MGSEIVRLQHLRLAGATLLMLIAGCGDSKAAHNDAAAPSQATAARPEPKGPRTGTIDRSHAGTPAPAVRFETAPGKTASLADYRGKKVLVNLWATWCAPCLAEMPALDRLAGTGKVQVLTISQDMAGWPAVNRFFKPGKFKTLKPVLDQPGSFVERLKAAGLPMSVLYNEQGREVWRVAGPMEWDKPAVAGVL